MAAPTRHASCTQLVSRLLAKIHQILEEYKGPFAIDKNLFPFIRSAFCSEDIRALVAMSYNHQK